MPTTSAHITGNTQTSPVDLASARAIDAVSSRRIWIDLDNTPHVPLFAPVIRELESRGFTTFVTARDAYQTCDLAELLGVIHTRVGRHYGKRLILKVGGTVLRAAQLAAAVGPRGACLAVSHGSRSQMLAARLIGVPSLALYDYEHVGRSPMAPTWVMTPSVIPDDAMRRVSSRILHYDGIKEDLYVPSFEPDASLRTRLGLDESDVVVLLRPPASEAHYHNARTGAMFSATLQHLAHTPAVKAIIVPRNARQSQQIEADWGRLISQGKFLLLRHAENGLNLIWHADVVVSGGGTMNREAAAMGVPVFSIFQGEIGAVDRWLTAQGRLTLLDGPEELERRLVLRRRERSVHVQPGGSPALRQVVDQIAAVSKDGSPA